MIPKWLIGEKDFFFTYFTKMKLNSFANKQTIEYCSRRILQVRKMLVQKWHNKLT